MKIFVVDIGVVSRPQAAAGDYSRSLSLAAVTQKFGLNRSPAFQAVAKKDMVCCLLCFDDGPIDNDPRQNYANKFKTDMMGATAADPICCIMSFCCLPCAQIKLRKDVLNGDMGQYKCCQGYFDNACFTAGTKGDQGSDLCLCGWTNLGRRAAHCLNGAGRDGEQHEARQQTRGVASR